MDAPPIQYARTEDGVNIAYWTLGQGPPLIHLPPIGVAWSQVLWGVPSFARELERLATAFRLIGLDPRGHGASDHDVDRLSLDDFAKDLEAVAAAAGLTRFAIIGDNLSAPIAIRYATLHPEQVSHLILLSPIIRGADHQTPVRDAIHEVTKLDSTIGLSATAEATGMDDADRAAFASIPRMGSIPDYHRQREAWSRFDVTADLTAVAAPSLILSFPDMTGFYGGAARETAAELQGQLIELRGTIVARAPVDRLHAFVTAQDVPPDRAPLGFRALLFTDLESSTALTQELGDAKAQELLDGHDTAVRAALTAHGGEEVKHTGDGIFGAFASAVSAVEAALQIQRDLAGAEVRVRIGLNAGEPIAKDDDYFGAAVQLAARVCDRAEPGQVLVSRVVMDLCAGKTFSFDDQGETTLKGFPEPVRLFVVAEGE